MRAQVSIQFIEGLKVTTAQKMSGEGPADITTSVSFTCKANPITLMRLNSLMKGNGSMDVTFTARQAEFDWQTDPGMEVIRKVRTPVDEMAVPAPMPEAVATNPLPEAPADAVKEAVAAVAQAQAVAEITATGAGILETEKSRITYDNTFSKETICGNCLKKDTEDCEAPASFRDCVTSCTGLREAPVAAADLKATVPDTATEPEGNGNGNGNRHKESTRYIPGRGRRKTAKAG